MCRNAGFSTSGEMDAVRLVGPMEPATNLGFPEVEQVVATSFAIFADCKYQPRITQHFANSKYPTYKPKLSRQSFCEGIEWYRDEPAEYVVIDGHKKIIKE